MNALKSFANPVPVRSLVVRYFTRFTTDFFKQQKKSKKSRRNRKFDRVIAARQNASWIGPKNPAKVH
jgi:hypothetical protein